MHSVLFFILFLFLFLFLFFILFFTLYFIFHFIFIFHLFFILFFLQALSPTFPCPVKTVQEYMKSTRTLLTFLLKSLWLLREFKEVVSTGSRVLNLFVQKAPLQSRDIGSQIISLIIDSQEEVRTYRRERDEKFFFCFSWSFFCFSSHFLSFCSICALFYYKISVIHILLRSYINFITFCYTNSIFYFSFYIIYFCIFHIMYSKIFFLDITIYVLLLLFIYQVFSS